MCTLIITLIGVILGVAIAIFMSRSISLPIKQITEQSKSIASGNLSAKVDIDWLVLKLAFEANCCSIAWAISSNAIPVLLTKLFPSMFPPSSNASTDCFASEVKLLEEH